MWLSWMVRAYKQDRQGALYTYLNAKLAASRSPSTSATEFGHGVILSRRWRWTMHLDHRLCPARSGAARCHSIFTSARKLLSHCRKCRGHKLTETCRHRRLRLEELVRVQTESARVSHVSAREHGSTCSKSGRRVGVACQVGQCGLSEVKSTAGHLSRSDERCAAVAKASDNDARKCSRPHGSHYRLDFPMHKSKGSS